MTLFEASDRLGGKVLTPSFRAAPVRYEAGAAELYDYTPVGEDPLRDLVAELGLPTTPLGGATVVVNGDAIANLDDLADSLGGDARRAVETFDLHARGMMTPREFYASDEAPPPAMQTFTGVLERIRHPAARRYVEAMIHSDLATEPDLTSTSYGLQNYLMNDPAYMRLYCIAGGNEQLIDAIAARITADIRLGTAVTEIRAVDDGGFELVSAHDRGDAGEPFDAVRRRGSRGCDPPPRRPVRPPGPLSSRDRALRRAFLAGPHRWRLPDARRLRRLLPLRRISPRA
jgi:monoamine oxidase